MINAEHSKILDQNGEEDLDLESIHLINENRIRIYNEKLEQVDKYFSNKTNDFDKAQCEFNNID